MARSNNTLSSMTTLPPESQISMSFEEGAILPMAIATAGVGIFLDLGIPRPTVTEKQSGGFLV